MKFIFDIQRFADNKTLAAGETYTLDGVTYTAGSSGATLNLDDDEKVSGIASGSVTATTSGSDATISFDATGGAINFTATASGKNITVKQLFPIEFISGEFTYKGNTLNVSAGSTLAIIDTSGNYSLRNENTFVYGGTYTFTNTAVTTESQRTISVFTLTNGTDTRTLNLEQRGKVVNTFGERGFTLLKGSSEVVKLGNYTLTATAKNDAALNIALDSKGATLVPRQGDGTLNVTLTRGDTTVLAGELECTSGEITFGYDNKVTFTKGTSFNFTQGDYVLTATATDDATASVSLTDGGISFTPGTNDGGLNLVLTRSGTTVFGGELNVSGGKITFDQTTQKVSFTNGTEVSIAIGGFNPQEFGFKVTGGNASFKAVADGAGNFTITPDEGDGSLDITLKQNGQTVFANNISVSGGSIIIGNMGQTIGLTKGTTVNVTLGNYSIAATADADASFQLGIQSDGSIAITPNSGDGKLDIVIKRGNTQIFANTVSVNGGTITFNPTTQAITLKNGTEISVSFSDYELVATAKGDATSVMSLTGNGIAITPNSGDGSLDLTLKTSSGSINANIEVLSGSFILGDGGKLTVTKGTELQIDFGDGYVVNFKATDEAGGSLSLGADGITFKPGSDDGGLELSITRDGETRTTNLNVTGSVTYKLDGTLSLAKGTVISNTWVDGAALKITATNDGVSSVRFDPDTGLTVTDSDNDLRLALTLPNGGVIDIDEITGTVIYKSGAVTLNEGTAIHMDNQSVAEQSISVDSGTLVIDFTEMAADPEVSMMGYSVSDNSRSVIKTVNVDKALICTGGSFKSGTNIQLLVPGSSIYGAAGDSGVGATTFSLDGDGEYTVNDIKITVSNIDLHDKDHYGTAIRLIDNKSIMFNPGTASISYDGFNFTGNMLVGIDNTGVLSLAASDGTSLVTLGNPEVTDGKITFDASTKKVTITAGTTVSVTRDGQVTTITAPKAISATYKLDDGIYYFDLDNDSTANVSIASGGKNVFAGELEFGGVLSFNPASGTFGLTGANSSHGNGENTFAQLNVNGYEIKMSTNDTTVVFVPTISDGKISLNFPNTRKDEMLFTISKDGNTLLDNQLIIGGTIGFDAASNQVSLTKGTVLTIVGDGENSLEITALDDASGNLTFTDDGIRFAPNAGDGQLELNFVTTDRKANIDVSAGALILKADRTLALEKGTVVNLTWEDGTQLKLTASDTGGSIGFDAQGLKISSDGELSIDLTTATGVQTTLLNLEGTIHYNAGKVLFDKDSTLTATSTLGGQPVNITLESNGTGGYIEISATGTRYVAGTGALAITWSRDGKSSTFSVGNGEIFIGHGVFNVAEGTELSTDLKDLVPALYFTTSEPGNYVINGQTVTTSAANISMTATDNQMTFSLREGDEVAVNDMTFAGAGDVIITADAVTVGDGVTATGFDKGKTFVLYEKGSVTVDQKIFELTEDVPTGISVTGADDGFIFSRTITAESEERLGIKDSQDIGKIFTERFIAKNDDSYRVQTDLLGLQKIIGVSDGASVTASAAIGGERMETIFDLVTDSTGTITVGRKAYALGGSSGVAVKADFEASNKSYVRGFDSLNGTARGNFTEHAVSLDGGNPIKIYGDTDVAISNSSNGIELFNLSDGINLANTGGASKAHTDTEGAFIFGEGEGDSIGVTVQGDPNVTFEFNLETQFVTNIANIEGNLIFSDTSNMCSINGIGGVFSGNFSSLGAYDNLLYLHDVADGSSLTTPDEDKIWLQQVGASMAVNENEFNLANDADGIWVRNREVVGLDEGASLQVSQVGNYTVNGANISVKSGDVIVGLDGDAYIFDANHPLITKNTSTDEIVDHFKPENFSVVGASAGGRFDISLTGGDLAIVENTAAQVKITAGDDTVVSQGKNVDISLTGGNTWLFALGGKMALHNYNPSTGSGFGTTYKDIASAVANGSINFELGKLSIGDAVAEFGTTTQLVNFFDRVGNLQLVGFAEHDQSLNASGETSNLLLVADNYSSVTGGSGNDTILADVGSFVDAGAGNNFVELSTERDAHDAGSTIYLSGGGNNTVTNFKNGFDRSSDRVLFDATDAIGFWFDGTNATIANEDGTEGVFQNLADDAPFVNLMTADNQSVTKVALAKDNAIITAGDTLADFYCGYNSGVDFTGCDGALMVNLNFPTGDTGSGEMLFVGINQVTAGDGQSTLMGSEYSETLTGGTGNSSLWTNAGDDVMIGSSGKTKFFFDVNDGRDTIQSFNFGTDAVNVFANTVTSVNSDSSGNVFVQINGGDDVLTIEDAAGKNFRFNDLTVNVDRNLTYNDAANQFVATGVDATLTVNESAEIWLNNQHSKFFDGDIAVIDATNSAGEILIAGNGRDNTILAGEGDASLWGGDGGDDLLHGCTSRNEFFYLAGNGSDTVTGANDGDAVELAGLTLAQISSAEISSGGVTLNFVDGGKLNVEGTAAIDFRINGETYAADFASGTWSKK